MSNKISVIIPAYKSQDVILNCLNSVCNQTYKNLEIIVVLKDSGDKTAEIIQKLNDPRIKVIKQNDDSGAGGARNIGLKSAHGDWIGFVETDDVIDLNFYQKLISADTDENIDILCGEIFNKNKPHNHFAPSKIYTTFTEKYNLIKNGATFDKIFKKSLVRKYNLKCSEKIRWEDNIFIFKAFYYAQKIKTVPAAVYYYNTHPFSESYKKILQNSVIPEVEEIVCFLNESNFTAAQKKLAYKKIIKSFAGAYLLDENIKPTLVKLMDNPLFLRILYWKKKFKLYRRNLKRFILERIKK